ncbi:MAG: serine/threonine protein kinase [Rhodanobacteraceae bacterium]|nr:serine/threonine protein kinase [Rhodanobacteraceae bacterium]
MSGDEHTRPEPVTQPLAPSPAAGAYAAGARVGRYRLLRKLGEGGMGVVWLAEQSEPIRREVALKLVQQALPDRATRARFEIERQALALLAHPGIAQILDAGTQPDGVAWFVMERVDGLRLDDWWRQAAPSLRARIELMIALGRAVGHAHRRGIVHCDLKPANVLVVEDVGGPRPKVIDFGIARAIGADTRGLDAGTPGYMPPEQQRASGALDARADVYALGVCLLQALGGRAHEPADATAASLRESVAALPLARSRRAELEALLARALAPDPAGRYEDAHALADELERWLQHRPLAALGARRGYRLRCWLRRHRWPALAAGAFLLMAAAFSVQLWRQYQQTLLERDTAEQVAQLLVDTFAAADPVQFPGGSANARELLAAASARVHKQPLPAPVRQRLLEALGSAQHSLELYADARRSYALALDSVPADDLPERDRVRLALARIDSDAEDYAGAETAAREIAQRQPASAPALAADSLLLLADNALLQDDAAAATRHVDNAAALVDPKDGDRRRRLAVVRARIASAQGDAQVAMRHQREALLLAAELWSAEDLRTLDLRNDLALYAGQGGAHAEAIAQLEQVAALTAAAWGGDSAGLATVYGNLGVNRLRSGDAAGAESEHRRAVAIFEQRLGAESVHTGTEYNNLASAIEAQGRAEESLAWFERAEAALVAAVGAEHFRVGVTLHNHARARIASGDLATARRLLDRSAAILEPALGREHPRWQVWRTSDAEWRLASGDVASALAALRETEPALVEAFGADSREARRAQGLLLRALAAAGRCEEAREYGRETGRTGTSPVPVCGG